MIQIMPGKEEHWPALKSYLLKDDSEDYVVYTWQDWLKNSDQGMVLVALIDEIPVGTTYISYINQELCYFQGIRIDSAYRRRGIGQALTKASVKEAKAQGFKRAVCGIDSDNLASQRVSTNAGFKRIGQYQAYLNELESLAERPKKKSLGSWNQVLAADLPEYLKMQKNSSEYKKMNGFLFSYGFYQLELSQSFLEEIEPWGDQIHFYKYEIDGEIKGFVNIFFGDEEGFDRKGFLVQGLLLAEDLDLPQFWQDFTGFFTRKEFDGYLIWIFPENPLLDFLKQVGFEILPGQGYQIWAQDLN